MKLNICMKFHEKITHFGHLRFNRFKKHKT